MNTISKSSTKWSTRNKVKSSQHFLKRLLLYDNACTFNAQRMGEILKNLDWANRFPFLQPKRLCTLQEVLWHMNNSNSKVKNFYTKEIRNHIEWWKKHLNMSGDYKQTKIMQILLTLNKYFFSKPILLINY